VGECLQKQLTREKNDGNIPTSMNEGQGKNHSPPPDSDDDKQTKEQGVPEQFHSYFTSNTVNIVIKKGQIKNAPQKITVLIIHKKMILSIK
jgi:hypothetical protein